MGTGWRRAFCTTAPRNSDAAAPDLDKQNGGNSFTPSPSPRNCVKLAFLSGGSYPSTPRTSSAPSLRCRTADVETPVADQIPTPRSTKSPRPLSPRSPLKLSLFRNSFKFRSSCGICLNSVKTGQGTAKYTAECSHAFHFHCIADYVRKQGKLVCPVCNILWHDASLLAPHRDAISPPEIQEKQVVVSASSSRSNPRPKQSRYDDDEPLFSPRFLTIPEADENSDGTAQFKGNVQVSLLPEAAVVSVWCGYETRAVALLVKAPPPPVDARGVVRRRLLDPSQRAPVDLVVVVGVILNGAKLQMVKRAIRLVTASLSSADRLSIVAATTKRLLPLKRMTEHGKRAAGIVVDGLLCGQCCNASDGLKKATKVLEDRRERNPIASIILLSDGQNQSGRFPKIHQPTGSTRFGQIEIDVDEYGFGESGGCSHDPAEEAFAKCIGGLLSVVVQDLRIQIRVGSGSGPCEVSAVYLCNGQEPTLMSSGSGSVRLGNLYAGEERELLVELRIPSTASMANQVLSVRGLYKDPSTQGVVYGRDQSLHVPQAQIRSTSTKPERLRCLFITTRAIVESRRLAEHGDCTSAHHLLTSARALLGQSETAEAAEYTKVLDEELVQVQWRGQQLLEYQNQHQQQGRRESKRDTTMILTDENNDSLTPASAWRAAEKFAKVALMKKSDLHGFENARF